MSEHPTPEAPSTLAVEGIPDAVQFTTHAVEVIANGEQPVALVTFDYERGAIHAILRAENHADVKETGQFLVELGEQLVQTAEENEPESPADEDDETVVEED